MISSPKTPAPDSLVGNLAANKVATNQQAIPVPYFSGLRWLPLIWGQSNIYNVKARAVSQKVGKSKQVTGYDYYGDLFGVLACCTLDYIEQIEVAGKIVWGGAIERGEDHPHHSGDIVVPGVATFRVYWGTVDQPADDLVLAGCGEDHPRYLELPYLVASECYFGNNNATPPTIRVRAERAARFEGLEELRSREGTNPVTTIAEVIANDFYGLGMPEVVHVASAAEQSLAMRRETPMPIPGAEDYVAAMGYLSPFLDRQQSAQAFFAAILEHYDGWLRPQDGQLKFGRFPHDGVIPEGLLELSHHDFVLGKKLVFEPSSDAAIVTDVTIVHLDREDSLEDAATPVPNPAARKRAGGPNERTFRRPFIVTTYQAMEQGEQLSRHYSREEEACSQAIRREKIVGLHAGDRFILVDALSESSQVVRITRRVDPSDGGEVPLSMVLERGLAPLAYVPPPQPIPYLPNPALVAIVNARIFQLPAAFADYGPAPAVVVLAQRPGAHVAGFTAHFSLADATYDQIAVIGRWALRATLAAGIASGAATFVVNATGDDLAILADQSTAAANDDTLLLIVGVEIMSIGAVAALGGGQYQLTVLRGRRASAATAHLLGAAAYIIRRDDLTVLQHADFPRTTSTRYFKLASYTRDEEQELADALALSLLFDDTGVGAPGTFAASAAPNGIFLSWTYPNPPDPSIIATDIWERDSSGAVPNPAVDLPNFSMLGTGFLRGALAAGVTKYFWALNRDTISSRSALVGPVNATATAATGTPGDPGDPGPTGNRVERRYKRSTLVPATPTGTDPVGWTVAMPSGSDALWASEATKDAGGSLVGSWSAPQRLSGSIIFYGSGVPSPVGYTLLEGDTAFDTADNNKIYRYSGGAWVAAFQPMFKLDGSNNISGLLKADGTDKDFVLVANKFQVWNGVSADVPFEIVGGATYIKNAFIQQLAAGKITAGTINAALALGSAGSLEVGSGYSRFHVDDAALTYGNIKMRQYPSVNGSQILAESGTHYISGSAWNSSGDTAVLAVGNSTTGKAAALYSTGLMRTNGPLEVTAAGSAAFDGPLTMGAQLNLNGSNKLNFANAGGGSYLQEDWGINAWGDNTHPLRLRGCSLVRGGTVDTYSAGNIFGFGIQLDPSGTLPNSILCGYAYGGDYAFGEYLAVSTQYGTRYIPCLSSAP